MVQRGWVDEVKDLIAKGYSTDAPGFEAIGYAEIYDYITKKDRALQDVITQIKRDTRHYIKRQLTFFKRDDRIQWFDVDELSTEQLINNILNILKLQGKER